MTDKYLTYNDVNIVPKYSKISSRSNVDISTELCGYELDIPVIASPMESVMGLQMFRILNRNGATGVFHRFNENQSLPGPIHTDAFIIPSIGVDNEPPEFYEHIDTVLIDVAHGHHEKVKLTIKYLKENTDLNIIAGNIATPEAAIDLIKWGADAIRVGVGGGSVCTTRMKTGVGVPMISCIQEISEATKSPQRSKYVQSLNSSEYRKIYQSNVPIIADGGMKSPGDCCIGPKERVLTANLRWKEAQNISRGDELIAFEEQSSKKKNDGRSRTRDYVTTKVIDNRSKTLPSTRISTDKGSITVSDNHMWLVKRTTGNSLVWCQTKDLRLSDKIVYFGDPWVESNTNNAAYLRGFLDGEGSLNSSKQEGEYGKKYNQSLSFNQAHGEVLDYAEKLFGKIDNSFDRYDRHENKDNLKTQGIVKLHGFYNILRFLGIVRPKRLLSQANKIWEESSVTNTEKANIKSLEDVGNRVVYTVSTTSSTFIAEGFMSHNSKALAAGADAVMLGSMLAGTDEAPGEIIEVDGQKMKKYYGSASMEQKGNNNYVEGVSELIPYKGSVVDILEDIKDGLQSAFSYVGASNLEEFHDNAELIEVSQNGHKEGTAHI